MLNKYSFSILFIWLLNVSLCAQLFKEDKINTDGVKRLYLNLDEVFNVEIISGDFAEISYFSEAEGEYSEVLQLEITHIKDEVYINSIFDALISSGFDKLSSHKVIAFQLQLMLPENLQIYLKSNITNVSLKGKLTNFEADLKSGNCLLTDFQGNATINTYKGNIELHTKHAKIEAKTRNGKLQIQQSSNAIFQIELKSLDGDISVYQLD